MSLRRTKPFRLARKKIYSGDWFTLNLDRVQFPGGRVVEKFHFLDFHKQSAATLIEDAKKGLLLVQSYRYPTNAIEWEVPAGIIDDGESILAAARREAREETGYKTIGHRRIYTFFPINGISNKTFHIVRCRAVSGGGAIDPNEVKSCRWFSLKAVEKMISAGKIRDGFSLAAILLYLHQLEK